MNKLLVAAALLASAAIAQAVPVISLDASAADVTAGNNFTVDVSVSGIEVGDQLLAFGFDVSAEPGLAFTGAAVGPDFVDDSGFFADTDVAGSVFPPIFGDGILLATLSFTADASPGLFDLSVLTSALDFGFSEGLFTELNTFDIAGTLSIDVQEAPPTPAPEPLTFWLLLGGLAPLLLAGRHQRRAGGP